MPEVHGDDGTRAEVKTTDFADLEHRGRAARSTSCASTRPSCRSSWPRPGATGSATATRSASGPGRPTRSRRAGTPRSRSSTRSGCYSRYVADLLSHSAPVPGRPRAAADRDPAAQRRRRRLRARRRRLHVPLPLRLLVDAAAQEPARARRGVHPRVRAERGAAAAAQELQRRLQARPPGAAARGRRRARRHRRRRPLRDRPAAREPHQPLRRLRLAAPRRRASASRWARRWRSASR